MADPTFMADPTRLGVSAIIGIVLLLALIIKFKLHPVLSMMVSAIFIGIGAGMPLDLVASTVTKGVGMTLQNIALLIGLGSMFGQILEESGGAKKIAQTFIDKFGQGHSSWALGITGLVIGTTVFFEAGVVVLIPLAFSVAFQTKKSTLYYGIAFLAGLAAGYAFVPPSAGSVLVAGTLGVDLGTLILVGVPTAFIAMAVAGVAWGRNVGGRFFVEVPEHVAAAEEEGDQKEAPSFGMVLAIALTPCASSCSARFPPTSPSRSRSPTCSRSSASPSWPSPWRPSSPCTCSARAAATPVPSSRRFSTAPSSPSA